jgi:anti-sigma factor RsiW
MDCPLIQQHLIGYHFATASDDERREVEAHLVACTPCLRTYLALKAHVDRGTQAGEAPSEAARLRLRAAVEARFRPTAARRVRRWLARPVPLYQGFAVAAVIVLAAALAPQVAGALRPSPSPAAGSVERVDSARTSAESLTIY